jgi:hypothetical protein
MELTKAPLALSVGSAFAAAAPAAAELVIATVNNGLVSALRTARERVQRFVQEHRS